MKVIVKLRLEESIKEKLKQAADAEGRTVSAVMVDLMEKHVRDGSIPDVVEKKKITSTTMTVDPETVQRFKTLVESTGFSAEGAIKAMVTNYLKEKNMLN